jgi:hypothetical protein
MVHSIRKAVSLCALLLLAGSAVPLRANPWKMAKATAVESLDHEPGRAGRSFAPVKLEGGATPRS